MPATGEGMLEIWTTAGPTQPFPDGPVVGAFGDGVAFGAIALNEAGPAPLEDVVEAAYGQIFDVLDRIGISVPVRFWNYLQAITDDERGLQRYMRFNLGRRGAFLARLRQPIPPAASGVGSRRGPSTIYVLAAREPARPVENPRQISAFAYPPVYGPASPGFETRHEGDVLAQIGETIENLRAVITAAGSRALPTAGDRWALKAYLRDKAYLEAVDTALIAMFGAESERLYLQADLCRPELLVEIEAFAMRLSDPGPPPAPVPC
jgi:enamine deaminase RidA (YjgF/YER057c/UK114 family)